VLADYNPPTLAERVASERAVKRVPKTSQPIPLGMPNPKHMRPNPNVPQPNGRQPYTGPSGAGAFFSNPTGGGHS
jgi:hypothetical protein